MKARVEKVEPLTDSILKIELCPEKYQPYLPGQYLQIIHQKERLSFSIANAPLGDHRYELHVRHNKHNTVLQALLETVKFKGEVDIEMPFGHCHLGTLMTDTPILFLAGGTGFAPVKAMIEQLLAEGDQRCLELYWGARTQSDVYMDDRTKYWAGHVPHFKYFSILTGRKKTLLADHVLKAHPDDLSDWQIVISGPFDMVFANRDVLVEAGVKNEVIFSDAFHL